MLYCILRQCLALAQPHHLQQHHCVQVMTGGYRHNLAYAVASSGIAQTFGSQGGMDLFFHFNENILQSSF